MLNNSFANIILKTSFSCTLYNFFRIRNLTSEHGLKIFELRVLFVLKIHHLVKASRVERKLVSLNHTHSSIHKTPEIASQFVTTTG